MNNFYFGSKAELLYGIIHEPEGTTIRDYAVLICYPFGEEYMITHRAMRTLSTNLARAGIPTMRFDYAGTGDSYGDVFSIEKCVENTVSAIHALMEFSGLETVKIIGLRLGAAIAALAAERSENVDHISLWDPAVSGVEYLNEITQNKSSLDLQDDTLRIKGYTIELPTKKEIESINLLKTNFSKVKRLHFVLSQPNIMAEELIKSVKSDGKCLTVDQSDLDDVNTWIRADNFGAFLLPFKTLKRIQQAILQN